MAVNPISRLKGAMVANRLGMTLLGMTVLGCATLLAACGQGEPSRPAAEAGKEQPQSLLGDQAAQEQASLARRTIELQQAAQQRGWREGHNATVDCLHGERAQTDGNELRCEDQAYVEQNYRKTNNR